MMLSETERIRLDDALKEYGRKREGILEALKAVQSSRGWVSDEALRDLAVYVEATPEEVEAIATFYPMIYRKPVGRHIIHYCDGVVCWIMGYEPIVARIRDVLGIRPGETSADGRFTLIPVSCIGRCDEAPALIIDGQVHKRVAPEDLEEVLAKYE